MGPEQQARLFDRLLALEELPQVKFDNVVRVLSKQYSAERLCRFVLKAAQNGFKLNENKVPLSLPDKLKLIHTAECVLSDTKGLDSDLSLELTRDLKRIGSDIENQLMVIRCIHEVQDVLSQSPGNQATRESLDNLSIRLANEVLPNSTLVRECDAYSMYEALIRLGKGPDMERKLVDFYAKHQSLYSEQLFRKWELFSAEQQRLFFKAIQSKLNEKAVQSDLSE